MRTICWSVAGAEWVGPDCLVAIGFDRTEAEHMERMLNHKARLTALGEISVGIAHEVAFPGLNPLQFTNTPNNGVVFFPVAPFSERSRSASIPATASSTIFVPIEILNA